MIPTKSPSDAPSRVAYMDGCRGIACLMITFYHCGVNLGLGRIVIWGFTGVHFFFVLSGYLLFKPFLKALTTSKSLPSLSRFYKRRFIRIYTPYIIALIVYTALRYVTHDKIPDHNNLFLHIVLIFNYFSDTLFYSINPVLWTLALEAQFYLLLPLLAIGMRATAGDNARQSVLVWVLAVIVLGCISRSIEFYLHAPSHSLAIMPLVHAPLRFKYVSSFLDLFGVGMLLAYLQTDPVAFAIRRRVPAKALVAGGLIMTLLGNYWYSFIVGQNSWNESNNLLFTIFFSPVICLGFGACLLAVALYRNGNVSILTWRPLVWVGTISYSVYLYHEGVEVFFIRHMHLERHIASWQMLGWANALLSLPFVLVGANIMFLLVEKPCLNWLAKPETA